MAEQVLEMKTGSSAEMYMTYTGDQDPAQPQSLDGYEITVKFVNTKTRVTLVTTTIGEGIEILDLDGGTYTVNPGDTTNFPLGDMRVDIKYTYGGISRHTDTFILRFSQGIS